MSTAWGRSDCLCDRGHVKWELVHGEIAGERPKVEVASVCAMWLHHQNGRACFPNKRCCIDLRVRRFNSVCTAGQVAVVCRRGPQSVFRCPYTKLIGKLSRLLAWACWPSSWPRPQPVWPWLSVQPSEPFQLGGLEPARRCWTTNPRTSHHPRRNPVRSQARLRRMVATVKHKQNKTKEGQSKYTDTDAES